MSQIEKLLIPLIDDNIKPEDVNVYDFVGVFTEDVNHPGLDYVYLVFVYDMENLRPRLSINGIDSVKRIGDYLYHVIKYPRVSSDLKNLLAGKYHSISNEGISKIFNFWKGVDDTTANFGFQKVLYEESYYRIIPEEKYIPLCKKESRGITVDKTVTLGTYFLFYFNTIVYRTG